MTLKVENSGSVLIMEMNGVKSRWLAGWLLKLYTSPYALLFCSKQLQLESLQPLLSLK